MIRTFTTLLIVSGCLVMSCRNAETLQFATHCELVLEGRQRALASANLTARSEEIVGQYLPHAFADLYLNKAVTDSTGAFSVIIALSQEADRHGIDSLLNADTTITRLGGREFAHTTDVQAAEWLRAGDTLRTYMFLEPGSGMLVYMATSAPQCDEQWFKRCVSIPAN